MLKSTIVAIENVMAERFFAAMQTLLQVPKAYASTDVHGTKIEKFVSLKNGVKFLATFPNGDTHSVTKSAIAWDNAKLQETAKSIADTLTSTPMGESSSKKVEEGTMKTEQSKPVAKKRGRPVGSKNAPKVAKKERQQNGWDSVTFTAEKFAPKVQVVAKKERTMAEKLVGLEGAKVAPVTPTPKKRGRPVGSKNKVKTATMPVAIAEVAPEKAIAHKQIAHVAKPAAKSTKVKKTSGNDKVSLITKAIVQLLENAQSYPNVTVPTVGKMWASPKKGDNVVIGLKSFSGRNKAYTLNVNSTRDNIVKFAGWYATVA